jgi:hypothetical protein
MPCRVGAISVAAETDIEYACIMAEPEKPDTLSIEYNPAAFKHGVSKENIRHVLRYAEYDAPMEGLDDKCIAIGFDTNANLLEIMYNPIDSHTVNVFHAMPCRAMFYPCLSFLGGTNAQND